MKNPPIEKYRALYGQMKPSEQRLYDYAMDVLNGDAVVCHWVKQACIRSFEFYRQWKEDDDYPYFFDPEQDYDRYENFCLTCIKHAQGQFGGKPFILRPWQKWFIGHALSWYKKVDGFRKHRFVHMEIPRSNGKSYVLSSLALFMLALDGELGPEIYSSATTTEQARKVFDVSNEMIKASGKIFKALGVQSRENDIRLRNEETYGRFKALSSDAGTHDGLNIHFLAVDEIHAWKRRQLFDVLVSGTAKRPQSLVWVATTAGLDKESFGFEQTNYTKQLLDGLLPEPNETFWGCIWSIDEGDDKWSEDSLIKANPGWYDSVDHDMVFSQRSKARMTVAARHEYFTKYLNIWMSGASIWIDMDKFDQCYDPKMKEDDDYNFCMIGVDLGQTSDLCVYSKVYVKNIKGEHHYYVFPHAETTQKMVDQNVCPSFPRWIDEKSLFIGGEDSIKQSAFKQKLMTAIGECQPVEVAFDHARGLDMMQDIDATGETTVVDVPQGASSRCEATIEFERAVLEGRMHWNNPVFRWCTSNAFLYETIDGLIKPVKENKHSNKKIDIVDSVINVLARCVVRNFETDTGPCIILFEN